MKYIHCCLKNVYFFLNLLYIKLIWSAESQVLIPAEHIWCDFKCRPWAKNASPNTNDTWVLSFHTLQNCCNRGGNTILSALIMFLSLLPQFGRVFFSSKEGCPSTFVHIMNVQVIGVWWWTFGSRSAFKVTQRCSAGIRTCLSSDQSSSSTLTESSFLFDPCLIHRDTVMLE